jgi:hypothetical protein
MLEAWVAIQLGHLFADLRNVAAQPLRAPSG